jgi:hypothetical protein
MRKLIHGLMVAAAAATMPAWAAAAGDASKIDASKTIGESVLHRAPMPPPLELSEARRAQIRQAVMREHSDVSFALKSAKPAQDFQPAAGAKLPKGLAAHPLPRPLVNELPVLKHYSYVKFRDDILIVNPMNKTIVQVIPQS